MSGKRVLILAGSVWPASSLECRSMPVLQRHKENSIHVCVAGPAPAPSVMRGGGITYSF